MKKIYKKIGLLVVVLMSHSIQSSSLDNIQGRIRKPLHDSSLSGELIRRSLYGSSLPLEIETNPIPFLLNSGPEPALNPINRPSTFLRLRPRVNNPYNSEVINIAEALKQSHLTYEQEEKKRREEQIKQDEAFARQLQQEEIALAAREQQEKIALQSFIGQLGPQIPLPPSLQNKRIYHLRARHQHGSTSCGYHSLANARSIQHLLSIKEPLTSAAIQKLNTEIFHKEGLEDIEATLELLDTEYEQLKSVEALPADELIYNPDATLFGNTLGIKNTYFITKYSFNPLLRVVRTSPDLNNRDNLIEALQALKTNDTLTVIHLPYLSGSAQDKGHWVYIGVVKEPGVLPYILYLDSCNSSLYNGSKTVEVLQELYSYIV